MSDVMRKETSALSIGESAISATTSYLTSPSTPPTLEIASKIANSTLECFLNGDRFVVSDHDGRGTLLDYIRRGAGLTGSKLGCSEGGCGACTVVLAHWNQEQGKPEYKAVNACIAPLISADGKQIITVEGIGTSAIPHMIQKRMAELNGSQCGFCTPGIIMSMYALVRNCQTEGRLPSDHEFGEALDGNLCRCTGYRPILEAAESVVKDLKVSLGCGKKDCCQVNANNKSKNEGTEKGSSCTVTFDTLKVPTTEAKELIFPPILRKKKLTLSKFGRTKTWYRPTSKFELLNTVNVHPESKLVSGASEVQVEIVGRGIEYPECIYVGDVGDMQSFEHMPGTGVSFGANIPLSNLETQLESLVAKSLNRHSTQAYAGICKQLKYFAGRQIRNVATPAGNIATASPISDLNPVLVAADATVQLESLLTGERVVSMSEFFTGYRKTQLQPGEVLTKVFVPEIKENEYFGVFKQAKRKDDDIAIVTAGMKIELEKGSTIRYARIVFGGVAPTVFVAKKTQECLKGRDINDSATLEAALDQILKEVNLAYDVPGGMASYRRTLAASFFYRFFNSALRSFNLKHDEDSLLEVERKFFEEETDHLTEQKKGGDQESIHLSAMKQVSGEAIYIDDMPPFHRELFGVQVMSTKAHAKVKNVDWSLALGCPGVVGYVDINDLPTPESNFWGAISVGKEVFFAHDEVNYVGQCIGVILAEDRMKAADAALKVEVEYDMLETVITLEDAISKNQFFGLKNPRLMRGRDSDAVYGKSVDKIELYEGYEQPSSRYHGEFDIEGSRKVVKGDVVGAFGSAKHVFEGTVRMGAQEHFYFETQGCIVVPEEDGELKIYSSSQNPTEAQHFAAQVTAVPASKVVCRVKRLGGGFGGKETRSVQLSSIAAVAAKKFKRPIRMILSRSEDMLTSGQRHPFLVKWKVSMDDQHRFTGLQALMYANAGWSMDLTRGVIDRAVLHIDNCYDFQNVFVEGYACKTNTASNTAFRGFGAPQGMFVAESIIYDVATQLNLEADTLRDINYYDKNAVTHYWQKIGVDFTVPEMVRQIKEEVGYEKLRQDVDDFNSKHKWLKRGLALVPTKFGVSFGALFLNQAGALIHIYEDGSILLSHGGTEMGQGLHTKMATICALELGVPMSNVFISETSTNTVANTSATAASASSDLNGGAVKNACDQLNERLKPYREKFGQDAPLSKLAHAAYLDRVNLSANGFYKTPDIGYVWGNFRDPGPSFFYYTQGVAVTEVEVDTLTGDWTNIRTDIKMDIGRPINANIDQGQIEGAFIQGQGLFTIEESLWSQQTGGLFTRGPGAYKIPGFKDIPPRFKVSMLADRDFEHLKTIHRSKGVGEPPLFLGCSSFFAIRDALKSSLKDHGKTEDKLLGLPCPMTTERIRNMAGDFLAEKGFVEPKGKEFFARA